MCEEKVRVGKGSHIATYKYRDIYKKGTHMKKYSVNDVVVEIIDISASGTFESDGMELLEESWALDVEPKIGELDREAIFKAFKERAGGYTLDAINEIASKLGVKGL